MLLLAQDLFFGSRIEGTARSLGREFDSCPSVETLLIRAVGAELVLIDLTIPELDVAGLLPRLRALDPPPKAVIAFGPHVFTTQLEAAREAGCDDVYTRGAFDRDMPAILARYGD